MISELEFSGGLRSIRLPRKMASNSPQRGLKSKIFKGQFTEDLEQIYDAEGSPFLGTRRGMARPVFFMLSKTGKSHRSAPSAEERGLKTEKSVLCESPFLGFRRKVLR